MRKFVSYSLPAAIIAILPLASAADVLPSAQDVRTAISSPASTRHDFALTGVITFVRQEDESLLLAVRDETGDVPLFYYRISQDYPDVSRRLRPGMKIHTTGHTYTFAHLRQLAVIDSLNCLGFDHTPLPRPISGPDLVSGRFDYQLSRITGVVHDFSRSELNANYIILVANCQGQKVYVSVPASKTSFDRIRELVNTEIAADGISLPFDCSLRANMGRIFKVANTESLHSIEVRDSSGKPIPDIESIGIAGPLDIALLGRHRAKGRVIAVWGDNLALLRTAQGRLAQLNFSQEPLPRYGDFIEACGLPETDLFQVNLTRASWRRLHSEKTADDRPLTIRADTITSFSNGILRVNRQLHGRAVRIQGRIVSLPVSESPLRQLYLASGTHIVTVEAQAIYERLSEAPVGSLVEISGTCIMDTEPWRPNMIFTKTRGFFLVTRTPDDIRVIERPSWWTPGRLLAVIGALFALLLAILVWNFSLRRLSEKKGLALARAKLAQSESALKVQERTRLATELHDSIVQNLTGASLHLRTADKLRANDPDAMHDQMSIAMKTIDSCRDEVRNCIWDLRNRALDEPLMDDAIRRTLAPHAGDVKLAIRFAVPRKLLTDNTAHGIICIIRELVLNAIRHGHATLIQVAGCIDNGRLLFSVKDNGCGFDIETAPGIEQGHFGLQGVRERIGLLQGDVAITSHPNEGSKVTISVRMPKEGKQ